MKTIDTAIKEIVAQGVATKSELMMRSRKKEIVRKRWQAWKILTDKGFNQSEIARRFKMNSATVHHGLKEIALVDKLKQIKSKIIKLR